MALADFIAYKNAFANGPELVSIMCPPATVVAGRPYDLWQVNAPAGVAPTAAVVPTNATLGSLGQQNGGSGTLGIIGGRFNSLNPGTYMICDRLSHQGGLSGITTGAQTTNLPTAALTRYTGGDGVMIGLTIYSAIGGTGTTVTASYTNQAGSSGQTTAAVAIGNTGFAAANRCILLPLAAGDTGVQAVANINLVATTGTAGNIGVTLFKPIYTIIVDDTAGQTITGYLTGNSFGGIPEIVDNACLFVMCLSASTSSSGAGSLFISEY